MKKLRCACRGACYSGMSVNTDILPDGAVAHPDMGGSTYNRLILLLAWDSHNYM